MLLILLYIVLLLYVVYCNWGIEYRPQIIFYCSSCEWACVVSSKKCVYSDINISPPPICIFFLDIIWSDHFSNRCQLYITRSFINRTNLTITKELFCWVIFHKTNTTHPLNTIRCRPTKKNKTTNNKQKQQKTKTWIRTNECMLLLLILRE